MSEGKGGRWFAVWSMGRKEDEEYECEDDVRVEIIYFVVFV